MHEGSQEWRDLCQPLRSMMDGRNGFAKDSTHESLAEPSNRRVRGFFANGLVAALTLAALNRGLADNSVGRTIDKIRRNDVVLLDEIGFAPLDETGAQLLLWYFAAA